MDDVLELEINGQRQRALVPQHHSLLEALRYSFRLTGSKQGCDKGDCGACTVLLDGIPVNSCITPAYEAAGRAVTTVEGLAEPGRLSPLQQAFEDHGAAQCGFCTPGILMSAHALLARHPAATRPEIREALAGNLCRCTGYTKIIDAVEAAGRVLLNGAAGSTAARAGGSAAALPLADDPTALPSDVGTAAHRPAEGSPHRGTAGGWNAAAAEDVEVRQ